MLHLLFSTLRSLFFWLTFSTILEHLSLEEWKNLPNSTLVARSLLKMIHSTKILIIVWFLMLSRKNAWIGFWNQPVSEKCFQESILNLHLFRVISLCKGRYNSLISFVLRKWSEVLLNLFVLVTPQLI